jgi:pimeloyl-ACP methyl ester carboxylesterase
MRAILLAFAIGCGAAPSKNATPSEPFHPTSFRVDVSGSGRPVIFIPGLTCDAHVWDDTIAHLGGKVRAHVVSLAGFAGAAPIEKALLPTVHDELVEYIHQNHLDHPIVVGHSLGAFMTFWLAETPDLIGGGVAVDGGPFFPALLDPKATVASSAEDAKEMRDRKNGSPEQFAAGVRTFIGTMMLDPSKHAALVERSAKSDPKTAADAMYFLLQTDLRPDLGKIDVPMLAIAADGNGEIPRAALEATWHAEIDAIRNHELVVIEHSKHFVMLDQPEAFYAALDKFLR